MDDFKKIRETLIAAIPKNLCINRQVGDVDNMPNERNEYTCREDWFINEENPHKHIVSNSYFITNKRNAIIEHTLFVDDQPQVECKYDQNRKQIVYMSGFLANKVFALGRYFPKAVYFPMQVIFDFYAFPIFKIGYIIIDELLYDIYALRIHPATKMHKERNILIYYNTSAKYYMKYIQFNDCGVVGKTISRKLL